MYNDPAYMHMFWHLPLSSTALYMCRYVMTVYITTGKYSYQMHVF